jgi:hypothetical protein
MTTSLLSASEVSRKVNVPVNRFLKAVKSGTIAPDQTVLDGRLFLFRADRVEEIAKQFAN